MPDIDIYSAKSGVEMMLVGINGITGTGISANSINVYVSTEEAANSVINRIGSNLYGYNLNIIRTDELKFL